MKFRRCKTQVIDGAGWIAGGVRYVWVPLDRAVLGAEIAIETDEHGEEDVVIVEMDTLVADNRTRIACEELPLP